MSVLRNEVQEHFNQSYMPCTTCRFAGICKYKDSMKPIDVPQMFKMTISCLEQEKLMKPERRNPNEQ